MCLCVCVCVLGEKNEAIFALDHPPLAGPRNFPDE